MCPFVSLIKAVRQLLSKGCEGLSKCALPFLNTLFPIEGHMVQLFAHHECQTPQADICLVLVAGYTSFTAKQCEKIFLADSFAAIGKLELVLSAILCGSLILLTAPIDI